MPPTRIPASRPVWVDPGWRRTVARYTVTFDEQGLSTTIFDFEIQALNEKGAGAIAQQTTAYNSYFDEFSVQRSRYAEGGWQRDRSR